MPKFSKDAFNKSTSLDLEKSSLDLEKPRRRNRVDNEPEYVNQFGERVVNCCWQFFFILNLV